ncbi:uncharacterized protein LY89DRAFT_686177 [Mollisia scopiformis]|uniref:Secreted protein n=1 Tax=Mollisia scopiformis TaxID=149040 RepID=A0A194X5S1_MOLSC|nr:uncharacterized protein LY89DRAFT_686177 [Mollisia scopiformis]KUJ15424.1 hypothetical protein LY89DRAFT_686177 [Mollisia scopiformis]
MHAHTTCTSSTHRTILLLLLADAAAYPRTICTFERTLTSEDSVSSLSWAHSVLFVSISEASLRTMRSANSPAAGT